MAASASTSRTPSSSDADSSIYDRRLDDLSDRDPLASPPSLASPTAVPSLQHDLRTLSLRTSSGRDPSPAAAAAAAASAYAHPIHYSFAQAFGERGADAPGPVVVEDADMISAVRFSPNTDMVATGDKGGRIVILKRVYRKHHTASSGSTARRSRSSSNRSPSSSPTRHAFPTYADLDDDDDGGSGGPGGTGRNGGSGGRRDDDDDDRDADDDDDSNADTRQHVVDAPEFRFWTQFQSHEPEFDYLKSMEIEEKINQIRWCRSAAGSQRLIATNDKTIKVWRVQERELKTVSRLNPRALSPRDEDVRPPPPIALPPSYQQQQLQNQQTQHQLEQQQHQQQLQQRQIQQQQAQHRAQQPRPSSHPPRRHGEHARHALGSPQPPPQPPQPCAPGGARQSVAPSLTGRTGFSSVLFPRLEPLGRVITATPRRVFSNAHAYHINSISLSSDEETFLSADDLRIHLWHLYKGGAGFNVLDIKPDNMEDLTEVITSAEFHPSHCHLFMYSSSRGIVKLCDLRQSALCHSAARKYEEREQTSTRTSFFSEIIASISDVKFSPDGQQILTRDYMNLRLWDMRMERAPLRVIPVHEHLRTRLCDLYENDCIFDKFQCSFSSDGGSLLTGSYNALFQAYSAQTGLGTAVEASVDFVSGLSARQRYASVVGNGLIGVGGPDLVDPRRRIMHLDSSTDEQIAAVAAGPALYLYYGARRYPGL